MIGPRHRITGDTLCDAHQPILLPSIRFAETVLSMAIEPESAAERKKLSATLDMLKRQDPTFNAVENEDTGQTLISGMGELHLEVIKHRLLREFKLDVKVHKPRVSYRETVCALAQVTGQCHRQVGGKQLFAKLDMTIEPAPAEKTPQVLCLCSPDEVPPELTAAAAEELRLCAEGGGPIGSFPLSGLKVTVTGGEIHLENSDETAFRIAAVDAFEKGLQAGGPVLLEPIMKLDITTPEEYLGDIVGDLQQRRALICSTRESRHECDYRVACSAARTARLCQCDPQPQPGACQLLDGAVQVRSRSAGGGEAVRDVAKLGGAGRLCRGVASKIPSATRSRVLTHLAAAL